MLILQPQSYITPEQQQQQAQQQVRAAQYHPGGLPPKAILYGSYVDPNLMQQAGPGSRNTSPGNTNGEGDRRSNTNLYIRGLLPSDTDETIRQLVSENANIDSDAINSTKAVLDEQTGQCKGYGFVDFRDETQAQLALDALAKVSLRSGKLQISYARESEKDPTNIYIKNLPIRAECNEDWMTRVFTEDLAKIITGRIISCRVMRATDPGTRQQTSATGAGFIRFEREQDAILSISHINKTGAGLGQRLGTARPLEAKLADKTNQRKKQRQQQQQQQQHQVQVQVQHHQHHAAAAAAAAAAAVAAAGQPAMQAPPASVAAAHQLASMAYLQQQHHHHQQQQQQQHQQQQQNSAAAAAAAAAAALAARGGYSALMPANAQHQQQQQQQQQQQLYGNQAVQGSAASLYAAAAAAAAAARASVAGGPTGGPTGGHAGYVFQTASMAATPSIYQIDPSAGYQMSGMYAAAAAAPHLLATAGHHNSGMYATTPDAQTMYYGLDPTAATYHQLGLTAASAEQQ